jgi:beta-lactam-binding protein with PASTA domain
MTRVYGIRTRTDYRPSPSAEPGQGPPVENADHIVANRYRLREQLGRGGMGVVWRARDERLERDVALKVLHPWVADDEDLRARFEREAAALARLEHPNVIRLYDVLEDQGQTVLVLELVEGDGLHTVVARRTLDWNETRRLLAPVAAALAHAHARGVVHRDLTPSNVLVERGTGRVVVTDFGLARLARGATTAPVSGVLAGTPEYWAPEQAAGTETGPATDLYALGCLLFQLLSGRLPFEGEDRLATGLRRAHEVAPSFRTVAPQAPDEAVRLVDRLLTRDPHARGTATQAALALGADAATLPRTPADRDARDDRSPAQPTTLVTRVLREPVTIVQRALREPVTIIREPATIVRQVRAQRSVPRARLAVVVLVMAAVVGLAGGVFAIAGGDPAGVEAPDVVGAKVAAGRTELVESARDADLPVPKLKVVDRSYSESAPAGAIIAQDPPQGDRITGNGALLVSVSRGSAYADVPSVAGLAGADAFALLERNGFTPSRTYSPSTEIDAWHAIGTAPETGARVKRPARVHVVVSTGPPRRPVPTLRGLDANAAANALRDAGFVASVDERPSTTVEPGSLLAVRPSPGARIPLGSTVTLVVSRAPHWEAVSHVEGTEDAEPEPFTVPAGARLVLRTVDTSPLGLFGGSVRVEVSGDSEAETEIDAGDSIVLADPSEAARTIAVAVDVDGSAHWTLAVEVPR